MTKVRHMPAIVFAALMLSIAVAAFDVQTLPQILVSSARRVSPLDSSSLSSSSAKSSTTFSSSPALSSSAASSLTRKGMLNSEEKISVDYDFRPAYTYTYNVNDLSTGDEKQQEGKREGVSVQGEYSFQEPEGSQRFFKYNEDNTNEFKTFDSRKTNTDEYQQSNPAPAIKSESLNGRSNSRPSSSRQSTATVSQNEQHISRPEAISLARRFPETVLGHRVQTSFINHRPILFTGKSGTIALTADGEENFKALRNAGKTIVERFQHPQTIIEQRPATTFITQLTPGRETLSLAHDILD